VAELLSIERDGEVALVTLERPEKRNALSIELRIELAETFGRLGDDAGVGCVVLTGAGTAFCSGMDVTQFGGDRDHKRRLVETSTLAFDAVGGCTRPVVAAVNGPAIAGGGGDQAPHPARARRLRGFLFEDERRAFHRALLGEDPDGA